MPNWCENELIIAGPPNLLKAFDEQFKSPHIVYEGGTTITDDVNDFLKVNPDIIEHRITSPKKQDYSVFGIEPDKPMYDVHYITKFYKKENHYSFSNFVLNGKETFLDGWYDWNIENWGTKWDLTMVIAPDKITDTNTKINYIFDTAWSPSLPVTQEMSKQYPDLLFVHKYKEPGMQIAGIMTYRGNQILATLETNPNTQNTYEGFL